MARLRPCCGPSGGMLRTRGRRPIKNAALNASDSTRKESTARTSSPRSAPEARRKAQPSRGLPRTHRRCCSAYGQESHRRSSVTAVHQQAANEILPPSQVRQACSSRSSRWEAVDKRSHHWSPRHLASHRRADPCYTLNGVEPLIWRHASHPSHRWSHTPDRPNGAGSGAWECIAQPETARDRQRRAGRTSGT